MAAYLQLISTGLMEDWCLHLSDYPTTSQLPQTLLQSLSRPQHVIESDITTNWKCSGEKYAINSGNVMRLKKRRKKTGQNFNDLRKVEILPKHTYCKEIFSLINYTPLTDMDR